MYELTADELEHYDRWVDAMAKGDPRLRELLAATLARFAIEALRQTLSDRGPESRMKLGDLPMSKGLPEDNASILYWLRDALERDVEWLADVDENGIPKLLSGCQSVEDLIDAAAEDQGVHWLKLPR
jgi:hypothetical protein